MQNKPLYRKEILGVPLMLGSFSAFVGQIVQRAKGRGPTSVFFCNVHMFTEALQNPMLLQAMQAADLIAPDGAPLRWPIRWLFGITQERVCGMDLLPVLLEQAQANGLRVFFYGGTPHTLEKIRQRVQAELPELLWAGSISPPFRALTAEETAADLAAISAAKPHLVLVSLGCPKQEYWIWRHKDSISACMMGLGQAFKTYAREETRLPKALRKFPVEWAFRLAQEPKRLWKRYWRSNVFFLWLMLQLIGAYIFGAPKLLMRLRRAAYHRWLRFVPLNQQFRPWLPAQAVELETNTVFAQEAVINPLPTRLYRLMNPLAVSNKPLVCNYKVARLPEGRIMAFHPHSVAVVAENGSYLPEFSFTFGERYASGKNQIFRQRFFTHPVRVEGSVFSMLTGGGGDDNYAHWMLDALPRLHLLMCSPWASEVSHLLVPKLPFAVQRECLAVLGYRQDQWLSTADHKHLQAASLLVSSAPRTDTGLVPTWAIRFHREVLLPRLELCDPGIPRVYLSREQANFRRVANQAEVEQVLAEFGFQACDPSAMSLAQQASLFWHARCVVGIHGAALTNVLFMQAGAAFLELFPKNFILSTYADPALKIGVYYDWMICEPQVFPVGLGSFPRYSNVWVDTAELRRKLAHLVSITSA